MKPFKNLAVLQKQLGYQFKEEAHLKQALTHKSATKRHNERLEFLGDAILSSIIAAWLFKKFPKATEGELTRARASLVKRPTLALVAVELGIGEHIYLGMGERRSGGVQRDSILADALEAIIGAIYLDAGFLQCTQSVESWFQKRMEVLNPTAQEKDPKTRLQEWLQARQISLPSYQVVTIEGESHQRTFTVNCQVEDLKLTAAATAASIRLAEQKAAQKIWELIIHDHS